MIRVAGLAKIILDNLNDSVKIDKPSVLQACLFHDIAKIISFRTVKDDEAEIRKECIKKYGDDEHVAANTIVSEIPLSDHAQEIIQNNNTRPFLDKIRNIMNSNDFEMKVLKYADSRISPDGLVTLKERWDDLVKRYPEKKGDPGNVEANEIMMAIEGHIQSRCGIDLLSIKQEDIDVLRRSFEVMEV